MRVLLMMICIVVCLTSCKDSSTTTDNGTLHIAIQQDPNKLNPVIYTVQKAREVYQYIFMPMADFHPETYELVPLLLKSIPQRRKIEEGRYAGKISFDVELREDATWADGTPITVDDYLFTLKAINHPETAAANYRSYMSSIVDARAHLTDSNKVVVILEDDYMLANEIVSTFELYPRHIYDPKGILDKVPLIKLLNPERAAETISQDSMLSVFATEFNSVKYSRDIVSGAGPYELTDWQADQTVVLTRKKDYWGADIDLPYMKTGPEKIVFHIIPDELSVMNQLKSGGIDLYPKASSAAYSELKANETYADDFSFYTVELLKTYFIAMNNKSPELQDPDVRRAMAHLMDVEEVIELLEGGLGTRATGFVNVQKKYHQKALQPLDENIEKAKSILTNEGWSDTNGNGTIDKIVDGSVLEFELDMHTTGSDLSNKIALILSENAKKAGIKINIIQKKYSDFKRENLATGKYDLITQSIAQSLAADDPYAKWHSNNASPGRTNSVGYVNSTADEIIDNIRSTQNPADRKKLYLQLQEVMYEDQPVIWLYHPVEKIILSKQWRGSVTAKRPGYLANTFTPAE